MGRSLSKTLVVLGSAASLAACGAPADSQESTERTSEAVCAESYDWHDFPNGMQCVGAVDGFFQAHFGVGLPALCQYPTQNGCQSCGACEFWEANAPNPSVWDRMSSGTPQLFDMIVYPPVNGNAYGHVAVVDHVSGSTVYVMDDNYIAYQTKASCPHTVSWGAYGWYRLKSLADKPPQGWLDSADCKQISGWAYDPDTPNQSIDVDFYLGGPAGSGAPGVRWAASVHRMDLCAAIGTCDHGYVVPAPLGLMDGTPHDVYPYGIDSSGNGDNPLLQGAPKSFTCPPPGIPYQPAVKRHVTDSTVFAAWSFRPVTDLAHLADATLDPIPPAVDIPAAPKLVTPDDGSAGVFIVDGSLLRHVQDPPSMTAWHFDGSALAKIPAAQFHAMTQGLPWPETPFLAQGSGPAIYMIDVTAAPDGGAPTEGGPGTPDAGGSAVEAGGDDGSTWANGDGSGQGSGCAIATLTSAPPAPPTLLLVGLAGLLAIRRTRPRS
jgi:hypothetical protein